VLTTYVSPTILPCCLSYFPNILLVDYLQLTILRVTPTFHPPPIRPFYVFQPQTPVCCNNLYAALYLLFPKHTTMKVSHIAQLCLTEPIEIVLHQQFGALGRKDEFRELMDLIDHLLSMDIPIERSIGACWERITQRDLWRDRYTSLASFKASIGFETLIQPAITYRDDIDYRKRLSMLKIEKNWGVAFVDILSGCGVPARPSKHFLAKMTVLSGMCSQSEARHLLSSARANHRRRTVESCLAVRDVQWAIEQLQGKRTPMSSGIIR